MRSDSAARRLTGSSRTFARGATERPGGPLRREVGVSNSPPCCTRETPVCPGEAKHCPSVPIVEAVGAPSEQGETATRAPFFPERAGTMRVVDCGVDTWKPIWYVEPDGREARWFTEHRRANLGEGGFVLADKIAEHRVGFDPVHSLVWAEGHPAPGALAKASQLRPAYEHLRTELDVNGVPLPAGRTRTVISRARRETGRGAPAAWTGFKSPGEAGFARLDVTADFETPTQLYGLEWLKALSAIQFSQGRARPYGAHNMWETIVVPSNSAKANRILGRVYDKGLESNAAPRGRLLRAEDQRRFNAERRRGVEAIDAAFLCDRWHRRFRHFEQANEEGGQMVTVADPITICALIQSRIESGELDPLKGERLVATVVLDYIAGNQRRGDRVTLWRRRRELRELGLVTDAGLLTAGQTEINVSEPFELASQPTLWE
jgi:hypothetical protein